MHGTISTVPMRLARHLRLEVVSTSIGMVIGWLGAGCTGAKPIFSLIESKANSPGMFFPQIGLKKSSSLLKCLSVESS